MLRTLFSLVISSAVLAGAYVYTFGVPGSVAAYFGPQQAADSSAGAAPSGRGGGGQFGGRGGGRSTTVVLSPIEIQPYQDVLRAIGTATALRSTNVMAEVSGEVTAVNLEANQMVAAGDILIELEARNEALNLEIAEAELAYARETVARYEQLQTNGNSTVTGVALSEARLALSLAEAKAGLARVSLDNRTIRAPIAGRLGLSSMDVGDSLANGSLIVTIDNAEALIVEFELPERAIGILQPQQVVRAMTPTFVGRVFEGRVTSFDSRVDPVTRSVTVRARIENPDGLLWSGMTFSVELSQASAPLAMVASTAITWSQSGASIWIDNDGAALAVPVTILYRQDESVWLEVDLPEGTLVVTEGAQKLRDGAPITSADAPRGRNSAGDAAAPNARRDTAPRAGEPT